MAAPDAAARYRAAGWWGDLALADIVRKRAEERPEDPAFISVNERLCWREYDTFSDDVAFALIEAGLQPGEKVAVFLRDGASAHVAFLGNEKAGLVTVGIGARAGRHEVGHLIARTGAVALLTHEEHRGLKSADLFAELRTEGLPLRTHVVLPVFEAHEDAGIRVNGELSSRSVQDAAASLDSRRLGPDDLFMINSTSGTTGLPKCVMHTQNSKLYMAQQACEVGELGAGEVVVGMAPIPFGFGLFSTHFLPAILGAPAVITDRFRAATAIDLVERERGTVLVCVSTQFKMMLNEPDFASRDLSSLKVMFTGGEMIPYEAARAFEEITGCSVLNFYGSNESGLATGTRVSDPPQIRLRTGGGKLRGTEVRLFDDGVDVTSSGRGQPGSRGPANCLGYYDDPEANTQLFTPDGFVLHADIVTLDENGYLTVVGRKSELIIRGGKNISAAVVEDAVSAHPAVALAAAVPYPDELFGEKVCVYVELRPQTTLTLDELVDFLRRDEASSENLPEYLVVLDQLPRSSGGKVAKGALAEDARRRAGLA